MSPTATWFGADQNQEIRFSLSNEAGSSALMSSDEWRLSKQLVAEKWVSSANRLSDFDRLVDDWDGLGATAPDQDVVQSAKIFLSLKRTQDPESPPSRVLAAPDGSVVFEWQSGSIIVEVEIDAPGRANYMLEVPGKSPRFWPERFEITSDTVLAFATETMPGTSDAALNALMDSALTGLMSYLESVPRLLGPGQRRDATWENSRQYSPTAA